MVEGEEDDRLIEDMSLSLFVDEIKVKSFFFFAKSGKNGFRGSQRNDEDV